MRKTLLTAVGAFVAGGIIAGATLSLAQTAPAPQPGAPGHPGMMMGHGQHPGPMGWHHGPGAGPMAGGWHMHGMRKFALIFRQPDRKLTAADVQKIAEAFLLWNGNHTWKVIDVAPASDGAIGFSIATPDGSVVAKFTMDPHTGHLNRVG